MVSALKVFELRSTHRKDKVLYHFVLKELMKNHGITWGGLPDDIFKETVIQEMKNLCNPGKLSDEIKDLESLPEYAKKVAGKFDSGSPFCTITDQFCSFFEDQIKVQLLSSAIELKNSFTFISHYLASSDEKILMQQIEAIPEISERHSKFVNAYKKEKAYKLKQNGVKLKKLQEPTKVATVKDQTGPLTNFTPTQVLSLTPRVVTIKEKITPGSEDRR